MQFMEDLSDRKAADAFSAMTTDRPYRKGMVEAWALHLLEKGTGTQWDPRCVQAFLTSMARPQLNKGSILKSSAL